MSDAKRPMSAALAAALGIVLDDHGDAAEVVEATPASIAQAVNETTEAKAAEAAEAAAEAAPEPVAEKPKRKRATKPKPEALPDEPGTDSANDAAAAAEDDGDGLVSKAATKRQGRPVGQPVSDMHANEEADLAKAVESIDQTGIPVAGTEDAPDVTAPKPVADDDLPKEVSGELAKIKERYQAALDRIAEQGERLRTVEAELAELRKATGGAQ